MVAPGARIEDRTVRSPLLERADVTIEGTLSAMMFGLEIVKKRGILRLLIG